MEPDLTSADDVKELMRSSENESQWNDNADKVKAANNNAYPVFWYGEIIASGLLNAVKVYW